MYMIAISYVNEAISYVSDHPTARPLQIWLRISCRDPYGNEAPGGGVITATLSTPDGVRSLPLQVPPGSPEVHTVSTPERGWL